MTTHLCPVCAMPKPEGLKHCSLKCEEADPLPQPEEEPCEGCRSGSIYPSQHTCGAPSVDGWAVEP